MPSIFMLFVFYKWRQSVNNLLYKSQYDFRKKHSTEHASLELVDRVMQHLDNAEGFFSTFMDLSKAFDCIDHNIMLDKLKYYGMDDISIKLMSSYLSPHQQYVQMNGVKSELEEMKIGVPQGSILGIYINDISNATKYLDAILYADDSTFSTSIKDLGCNDDKEIEDKINSELDDVKNWLRANRLLLNINKNKYMIFHRTGWNIPDIEPCIDGIKLEAVNDFNFLGLTINQSLDWTPHLSVTSRKLSRALGILHRVKSFVPASTMKTLYYSLVQSHLIFQILNWGYECSQLEGLQKRAIRAINNTHYLAHTDRPTVPRKQADKSKRPARNSAVQILP